MTNFKERNAFSENDEAYRACLQELEELIEQLMEQVVQVETVDSLEASSSPVVTSRTCRRLFRQSTQAEEHGTVSGGQEPVEQDDFPIDDASNDDDSEEDYEEAIPNNRLSIP